MLWFILCVAVLNIGMGFGLAVYLARYSAGCGLRLGRARGVVQPEPGDLNAAIEAAMEASTPRAAALPAVADVAFRPGEDEVIRPDREPRLSDDDSIDSGGVFGGSVMEELDAAVSAALGEGELRGAAERKAESEEASSSVPAESSLVAFHAQLDRFCEELIAFDAELRSDSSLEPAEWKTRIDSVTESSRRHEKACDQAERSLQEMIGEELLDEKQGEAAIAAIQEGREEIVQAGEFFGRVELEGGVAAQRQKILERTGEWVGKNHHLRDTLSEMVPRARHEGVEEESCLQIDPLTQLLTRSAFSALLTEHWRKDPHHARSVALTVIDIDHFGRLNGQYGPAVGDRVLVMIARLLESESPGESRVARFAGQRFAFLEIDCDLKRVVTDAERIRQTVEMLRMEQGNHEIQITVSCGVVSATTEDTLEKLYARAGRSLEEAKRYGRNRTFVHEGEYPTPVVPPNFALSEKYATL